MLVEADEWCGPLVGLIGAEVHPTDALCRVCSDDIRRAELSQVSGQRLSGGVSMIFCLIAAAFVIKPFHQLPGFSVATGSKEATPWPDLYI